MLSASATTGQVAGCPQTVMNIVAHQDDDILFQNPSIQQAIDAGDCVRTVYLTAGDDGMGPSYWEEREAGSEAAYLQMLSYAGFDTTADTEQEQVLNVRDATRATHHLVAVSPTNDPRVTQIFLRLPDGFPTGTGTAAYGFASLTKLWVAANDATGAVVGPLPPASQQVVDPSVDGANFYTAAGLVSTLEQLMVDYRPTVIQIQDDRLLPYHDASGNLTGALLGGFCSGPTGPPDSAGPIVSLAACSFALNPTDHADHIAGAHFVDGSSAQYSTPHTLVSYEDDPLSTRAAGFDGVAPANSIVLEDQKYGTFLVYLTHDPVLVAGLKASSSVENTYALWIAREHVVGTTASG
jgi:LmbE family N-acetylglucosaminyl deacetylase